jgi:hypothetical protein
MSLTRVSRAIAGLVAVLFAAAGLSIWISPAEAATRFGLQVANARGLVSLRADLGGLFVGLALVTAAGVITRRRSWSLASAGILGSVAAGRAIAWIAHSYRPQRLTQVNHRFRLGLTCEPEQKADLCAAHARVLRRAGSSARSVGWFRQAVTCALFDVTHGPQRGRPVDDLFPWG